MRLTSECWSRHLPAGLHTPLGTLGRTLGSQLQNAEVIQGRWDSVWALKIPTATFLSKWLCSRLPHPPWTMRETTPHHVNIWNSLIFLCPTTTALCWHWKFKETFGSSYLWFVNCQVLFNTFQTSVLCRIRTRSKFKVVPLPGYISESDYIHCINLPVRRMCLWKAPSKTATEGTSTTKVLPCAYETTLKYAACCSAQDCFLCIGHKKAIQPMFLMEMWLLSLWTVNTLHSRSLHMQHHAIL